MDTGTTAPLILLTVPIVAKNVPHPSHIKEDEETSGAAFCGVLMGEGSRPQPTPDKTVCVCAPTEGGTCEDVAVLGLDEAPSHEGAHGDVPAGGAAEGRVAGALAPKLVQGEGVGAVPLHHGHHEV